MSISEKNIFNKWKYLFSNYKRLWSSLKSLETEQLCINTNCFSQYTIAAGILTISFLSCLCDCVSIEGSQLRRPVNQYPQKSTVFFFFGLRKDFYGPELTNNWMSAWQAKGAGALTGINLNVTFTQKWMIISLCFKIWRPRLINSSVGKNVGKTDWWSGKRN